MSYLIYTTETAAWARADKEGQRQNLPWHRDSAVNVTRYLTAPSTVEDGLHVLSADAYEIDEDDEPNVPLAWAPGIAVASGQIMEFEGDLVRVLSAHTTQSDWTPDRAVSLFSRTLLDSVVRDWRQPTGAHDAYPRGMVVLYEGKRWKNTGSDANVWEPGVFGWEETFETDDLI